jgi:orotidine-5'-phosphate decarboxylase
MGFLDKLAAAREANNSLLCIGLDPDLDKLPSGFQEAVAPYLEFNKAIIDATAELVCAYKPNSAFYEARGVAGLQELKQTCDYINQQYPDIPIILDFKRADIGNTNQHYAKFAFDYLGVDAITIHPYLGREAVSAFLDYKDKGIIVLCKTSNDGAAEFQDLLVNDQKLYLRVAEQVKNTWNENGNCLLVAGATFPEELADIRRLVGDEMTLLVPGIGAQGGDMEQTMKAGLNSYGNGLIINSARAILYASAGEDYAEAAKKVASRTNNEINKYRGGTR